MAIKQDSAILEHQKLAYILDALLDISETIPPITVVNAVHKEMRLSGLTNTQLIEALVQS